MTSSSLRRPSCLLAIVLLSACGADPVVSEDLLTDGGTGGAHTKERAPNPALLPIGHDAYFDCERPSSRTLAATIDPGFRVVESVDAPIGLDERDRFAVSASGRIFVMSDADDGVIRDYGTWPTFVESNTTFDPILVRHRDRHEVFVTQYAAFDGETFLASYVSSASFREGGVYIALPGKPGFTIDADRPVAVRRIGDHIFIVAANLGTGGASSSASAKLYRLSVDNISAAPTEVLRFSESFASISSVSFLGDDVFVSTSRTVSRETVHSTHVFSLEMLRTTTTPLVIPPPSTGRYRAPFAHALEAMNGVVMLGSPLGARPTENDFPTTYLVRRTERGLETARPVTYPRCLRVQQAFASGGDLVLLVDGSVSGARKRRFLRLRVRAQGEVDPPLENEPDAGVPDGGTIDAGAPDSGEQGACAEGAAGMPSVTLDPAWMLVESAEIPEALQVSGPIVAIEKNEVLAAETGTGFMRSWGQWPDLAPSEETIDPLLPEHRATLEQASVRSAVNDEGHLVIAYDRVAVGGVYVRTPAGTEARIPVTFPMSAHALGGFLFVGAKSVNGVVATNPRQGEPGVFRTPISTLTTSLPSPVARALQRTFFFDMALLGAQPILTVTGAGGRHGTGTHLLDRAVLLTSMNLTRLPTLGRGLYRRDVDTSVGIREGVAVVDFTAARVDVLRLVEGTLAAEPALSWRNKCVSAAHTFALDGDFVIAFNTLDGPHRFLRIRPR